MDIMEQPASLIAVVGATATGKTRRAVAIARSVGGEILSADSRQVYRRMDIGIWRCADAPDRYMRAWRKV